MIEHFGRKCKGATEDPYTFRIIPCPYRFRFKCCEACGAENDIAARVCCECDATIVDSDKKLREAMALKGAHVMRPDSMHFDKGADRKGRERLEIRYYDLDGNHLTEYFYFGSHADTRGFYYNFVRMHARRPELKLQVESVDEVLGNLDRFRMPLYVIAQKKNHYWQVREKIFE